MLAKMGYQKGHALGKHQTGSLEPLDLVLKEKRTGLGVDETRKEREEKVLEEQIERSK